MKYLVEVETVINGEIFPAGSIIENPENVVAGLVRIEEEAPAPKAKKSKKEVVEEVKEEILTEESASIDVETEEE